ncbi:ribosome small subunit-dependent GTPase A [Niallia sp. 03133]|uniref:ribosome small subunit-dependent GTPase A n=1 Tax=Niallia sp. 03133 TaxID=3458060 RepID=UPI0040447F22
MELTMFGYNEEIGKAFENYGAVEQIVGRVALEHKRLYRVWTYYGELLCEVSGKFSFTANTRENYPAVGDWVVITPRVEEGKGTISFVLPRKSKFSRKVAGANTEEQIVATNVDTILLVNSLNEDLNLRRIERYLTLTWESGANPVIVLTKADLSDHVDEAIALVESVAFGVPVYPISVMEDSGFDELNKLLLPGKTFALLGSSGVGKSTLTNYLLGYNKQEVQNIRNDDKGKHTTTHRELILLPNGCILIDTPGMRELQLWNSDEGLSGSFTDIEELAVHCKFRDCAHEGEKGCAIKEAIESGVLLEERLASYKKLLKELAFLKRKQDKKAQSDEKKKWKKMNKQLKTNKK